MIGTVPGRELDANVRFHSHTFEPSARESSIHVIASKVLSEVPSHQPPHAVTQQSREVAHIRHEQLLHPSPGRIIAERRAPSAGKAS